MILILITLLSEQTLTFDEFLLISFSTNFIASSHNLHLILSKIPNCTGSSSSSSSTDSTLSALAPVAKEMYQISMNGILVEWMFKTTFFEC